LSERIPYPDPIEDAEKRLDEAMAEAIFGQGPNERVRALRESVLGPQPSGAWRGLSAWLPKRSPSLVCAHCGNEPEPEPITWRCPDCGAAYCESCQYTELDCYDLDRKCPGCAKALPDSDGNTPTDWKALGYVP
jgi:hypothetical protein